MFRLGQVLFWSIIAAAFIGPGTVTTAAVAGAGYGYALLWALAFSALATLLLQEASARVTIVTGRSLASTIRQRYVDRPLGMVVVLIIGGAIILGCAGYQAGNILGSVAAVTLRLEISEQLVTLAVSLLAGLLLFFGSTRFIARLLGAIVAVMGISFLISAATVAPPLDDIIEGAVIPRIPTGSSVLVLGLIGTTVVPYNLFLGSGIAYGQNLADARFGICVAVVLGGIISMGILIVGTTLYGAFSFDALADALARTLGGWAAWMFAVGLFAAGFSSVITAPLAAAITARGLFASPGDNHWHHRSWRYRSVWATVLSCGLAFGLAGIRPIPAIILAQALNGLLLPLVAAFLYLIVNDRELLGREHTSTDGHNLLMLLIFSVTVLIGTNSILRAIGRVFENGEVDPKTTLALALAISVVVGIILWRKAHRIRHPGQFE